MGCDTIYDSQIKQLVAITNWDKNWRVVHKQAHEVAAKCQQIYQIKLIIIANQVSQANMTS